MASTVFIIGSGCKTIPDPPPYGLLSKRLFLSSENSLGFQVEIDNLFLEIALEIIPCDRNSCMSSGKIVTMLKCI